MTVEQRMAIRLRAVELATLSALVVDESEAKDLRTASNDIMALLDALERAQAQPMKCGHAVLTMGCETCAEWARAMPLPDRRTALALLWSLEPGPPADEAKIATMSQIKDIYAEGFECAKKLYRVEEHAAEVMKLRRILVLAIAKSGHLACVRYDGNTGALADLHAPDCWVRLADEATRG